MAAICHYELSIDMVVICVHVSLCCCSGHNIVLSLWTDQTQRSNLDGCEEQVTHPLLLVTVFHYDPTIGMPHMFMYGCCSGHNATPDPVR